MPQWNTEATGYYKNKLFKTIEIHLNFSILTDSFLPTGQPVKVRF